MSPRRGDERPPRREGPRRGAPPSPVPGPDGRGPRTVPRGRTAARTAPADRAHGGPAVRGPVPGGPPDNGAPEHSGPAHRGPEHGGEAPRRRRTGPEAAPPRPPVSTRRTVRPAGTPPSSPPPRPATTGRRPRRRLRGRRGRRRHDGAAHRAASPPPQAPGPRRGGGGGQGARARTQGASGRRRRGRRARRSRHHRRRRRSARGEAQRPGRHRREDRRPDVAPPRRFRRGGKKPPSFWKELPLLVVVALLLTFLIQTFLAKVYVIPSGSMETTLHGCTGCNNDRVLVDKVTYRFADPPPGRRRRVPRAGQLEQRGQRRSRRTTRWSAGLQQLGSLIGLAPPDEKDFVKRVIAVGGQTVQCCDSRNRVHGRRPAARRALHLLPARGRPGPAGRRSGRSRCPQGSCG